MRTSSLHMASLSPHFSVTPRLLQKPIVNTSDSVHFGNFDDPPEKNLSLKERLLIFVGAPTGMAVAITAIDSIICGEFAGPLKMLVDLFNK